MLKTRVITALVGVPVVLACGYWGGAPLFVLLAALSLLAMGEFWGMLGEKGVRGLRALSGAAAVAMVAAGVAGREDVLAAVLAVSVILALGVQVFRRSAYTVVDAHATLAGLVYLGYLNAYPGLLRHLGLWPLALAVGVTWATDTAAYFTGMAIGRRKLCPDLSPGKTIEGAVGGMIAAVVFGGLGGVYLAGLSVAGAAAFGLVTGAAAQVGDLAESALKRSCGIKDSGRLLPGHGGVLDRFDSLLFSAPVAYYALNLLALMRR